jgi:hypothetical protein
LHQFNWLGLAVGRIPVAVVAVVVVVVVVVEVEVEVTNGNDRNQCLKDVPLL